MLFRSLHIMERLAPRCPVRNGAANSTPIQITQRESFRPETLVVASQEIAATRSHDGQKGLPSAGIELLDVTDGIVRLRLNGACAGCPATIMSLVLSLQQELRARVPEVEYLEAVP